MKADTPFWTWFDTVRPFLARRVRCFEKTFQYLDTLPAPIIIIETGCIRRDPLKPSAWTADGCSTLMFDRYVQDRGGDVYSVDIAEDHVAACRDVVSDHTHVHCGDSVRHLEDLARQGVRPSLVYLDSFDRISNEPFETALHCAREFDAIKPAITDDTLVVIDDTPAVFVKGVQPTVEMTGKGAFVRVHADHVGAETLFSEWMMGWTKMVGLRWEVGEYDKALFGRRGRYLDLDYDVDQLIGRARRHIEVDQTADAEAAYRAVLRATKEPKTGMQRVAHGEACAFYARTAYAVGQHGTALDWYRDAIRVDPRCVDYRIESVVKGHVPMMGFQLARQEAIRCTVLEPENPTCWRILGDAEMALCNAAAARGAYEKELALAATDDARTHAMLDVCCIALDQADYERCAELAEKVVGTERHADGLHVLAMIANRDGRHEEAIDLFQMAIDAKCSNHLIAHWNRSLSLLALGRYREGWAEHEFRKSDFRNPALSLSFMRFNAPLYTGQPSTIGPDVPSVKGWDGTTWDHPLRRKASLLVHAEAGMGDNFAFVRFLPEFVAKGFEVRYECHPEMRALIQRSFPDVKVIPRAPDFPGAIGIEPFDYHLPLGSMAHVLGKDIDTVRVPCPYLVPDPALVAKYARFGSVHGRKIGLCWSSGIREYGIWIAEYGRRKSMHFDQIRPNQTALETDIFVNLQVGPERAQHGGVLLDMLPEKPNWDDTAALIANLDIVITVDTAVAHLAGAMGKPTWLMMQQDGASWHFMAERPGFDWNERSPWYQSVRIFRQKQPGDWNGVVKAITKELQR